MKRGRMLSTAEVAARYGVNPATVRRWITSGRLKAKRLGKRSWAIDPGEFDTFTRPKKGRRKVSK